jgi:tetratricopeptide (TPR) repeat protein
MIDLFQRAAAIALLMGFAGTAGADPASDARNHYQQARSAYALGNWDKAASEFEKAFEIKSDRALLYNAAQAHRLAGNKPRALLLYQNYLRFFGDQIANADEVERHIAALKTAIESEERLRTSPPVVPIVPRELPPSKDEARPAVVLTIAPPPPAQLPGHRPIYKRWWLWTAVGAVVVAAAVGGGIAAASSGSSERSFTPIRVQ